MHKLLQRQLKKLSIAPNKAPDVVQWSLLLDRISQSYDDVDRDRYTVQRSLDIASLEMQSLYAQQRESLEARQALILDAIPDVLFLLDEDGLYVDILANDGSSLLYKDKSVLIGKKLHAVLPKESADQFLDAIHKALQTGEVQKIRYQLNVGKGLVHFEGRVTTTKQQENNKSTVLFLARDIGDVVEAENQQKLLTTVMDSAKDGLVVVRGADKKVLYANQAMATITGIALDTLLNEGEGFLRHEEDTELCSNICQLASENNHLQKEIIIHINNEKIAPVLLNLTTVRSESGDIDYFIGVLADMAELKKSKELLLFNATHDVLTKLPNRLMFEDRFKDSLARAKRSGISGALLFLDLDGFKSINDSFGHDVGDSFLKEVSQRLQSVCRDVDTVARFGGDEFVIIFENIGNQETVIPLLDNIFKKLSAKITLEGIELDVSVSIGVTIFPEHGDEKLMLIKQADQAMYVAKKSGNNQFHIFTPD